MWKRAIEESSLEVCEFLEAGAFTQQIVQAFQTGPRKNYQLAQTRTLYCFAQERPSGHAARLKSCPVTKLLLPWLSRLFRKCWSRSVQELRRKNLYTSQNRSRESSLAHKINRDPTVCLECVSKMVE
jgi:hypothetical protein